MNMFTQRLRIHLSIRLYSHQVIRMSHSIVLVYFFGLSVAWYAFEVQLLRIKLNLTEIASIDMYCTH